jgi:hypothetical protein
MKGRNVMAKKEVVKQLDKETPLDVIAQEDSKKTRRPGNWIKATERDIVDYEKAGVLFGYDPQNGEVLLKEGSK